MTRVFSGIQPSGDLHLGNYLGALVNWVRMQETHDCVYSIVDMHAITAPRGHDPAELRQRTLDMATALLAIGVDPQRSVLFVQSHVGDLHAEATWLFNCVTGYGELAKQPQFKEKSAEADRVTAGLFDYPVLQTADIVLYDTDEVPVGEDQRHHIELARDIAGRFNHTFGEVFVLPKAIHPPAAARVMDLQRPTSKMSKSADSPKGTVQLLADPKRITKQFRSAVTDSGTEVVHDRQDKPGVSNLLEIMSVATGRDVEDLVAEYGDGGYGAFKTAVAEAVVEMLRPVQERHAELVDDPAEVRRILADGSDRARAIAEPKLAAARDAVGFLPRS